MRKNQQLFKKKLVQFLIIIQLLLVNTALIFSQSVDMTYSVENFFVNEGLPVIRIYDIAQDKKGLLWICTESGLYSFNGTDFELQINFGEINYYPNKLLFDNNENTWLIKYKYPNAIIKTGTVEEIKIFNSNSNQIDHRSYIGQDLLQAINLHQNKSGSINFQIGSNGFSFDQETKNHNLTIPNSTIVYSDEELLVTNNNDDIVITDAKTNTELQRIPNSQAAMVDRYNEEICIKYINGHFSFYPIQSNDKEIKEYIHNEDTYIVKPVDEAGIEWSISSSSIKRFNYNSKKFEGNDEDFYFKQGSYLTSIFIDRESNVWVGSNLGLYKISTHRNKQFTFSRPLQKSTRSILQLSDKNLFISSYEGDLIYNLETKSIKNIASDHIKYSSIKNGEYYYTIDNQNILNKRSIESHDILAKREINIGPDNPSNPGVLIKLAENKMILKLSHKLFTFGPDLELKLIYQNDDLGFRNIKLFDNKIYLASSAGLKVLNQNYELEATYLPQYIITNVHKDLQEPSILWLTTTSFLIRLDTGTEDIKIYNTDAGFISSIFTSIREDSKGNLWLPSFAGLNRFNKETEEIKVYQLEDGIANNEFNNYSTSILENGNYIFGGISGITVVNPNQVTEATIQIPDIQIYECTKLNSIQLNDITETVNNDRVIVIEEKDVLTNIKFAHYSYKKLKSKIFRYRIFKLEESEIIVPWTKLYSNQLQLGKMPYGKYKLEFQAITRTGEKLSIVNNIDLDYMKPFMKTNLFKLFSILFFAAIIYFIIHIRSQSLIQQKIILEKEVTQRTILIQQQKQELEQINNTKDKLFSILAHDLKSPLITLKNISGKINYLIQKKQPDRILEIGKTIEEKVSGLNIFLDNLLNWSLQQRGHLTYNPEFISLQELTDEILYIYEDQILEKKLNVLVNIPSELKCYADKNSIHAVIRNLISNAIKYSPEGKCLNLSYSKGKKLNIFSIMDNGKGIDQKIIESLYNNEKIQSEKGTKGEVGTGLGLVISKELVELNKGHIKFLTHTNEGTRIQVYLPRNKTIDTSP